MQKTITRVFPNPKEWGPKYPKMCSISVEFEDGSEGAVSCEKDQAETVKETLKKLLDKPTEFVMDGEPREYKGVLEYKVKEYPGKPQGAQRGGGSGGGQAAWKNTEAGLRYEQERMDRRTAVMQAVANNPGQTMSELRKSTETIYTLLRETAGNVATAAPAATTAASATTQKKTENTVWAGDIPCPGCNAPPGKYHATNCQYQDPFADGD